MLDDGLMKIALREAVHGERQQAVLAKPIGKLGQVVSYERFSGSRFCQPQADPQELVDSPIS
ncbi:MAG: hypothetical protein U7123_23735 [Potamolinea sp.]